jgi:hypothetical protein
MRREQIKYVLSCRFLHLSQAASQTQRCVVGCKAWPETERRPPRCRRLRSLALLVRVVVQCKRSLIMSISRERGRVDLLFRNPSRLASMELFVACIHGVLFAQCPWDGR